MANIQQQIQIHDILKDGEIVDLMPITTAQDVQVGKQETGSLTLPGSDGSEVLSETLSNIRKYLFNLSSLASMARKASSNPNDASEINIPTTAVTTKLTNSIEEMVLRVDTLETTVEKKVAPTSHSSENNTYGIGNTTMYGHVKLSDIYKSEVANGNANSGVGASQKAIYDTYTTLLSSTAPTSHASALNTYGVASKTEYGHVKLSDEYEKKVGNGDAANGMAASQNALYNAYNYLYEERLSINGGTILGEIKFGDIHGDNSNGIYPTGTLSGTLGGTNNRWKNAYTAEIDNSGEINTNSLCVTATITENGTTLADKYAAKSHTHSYLPLSGGTVTGDLIADDIIATRISGVTITENGTTLADKYAAKSHTHSYLPLSGGTVTGDLIADDIIATRISGVTITENGTTLADKYAAKSHTHSYLPLSGGTVTGDLKFAESGTTIRGISGRVGTNDAWRVVGGATGENGGYLEIATTDDGNEPIYVRQYKDEDGGGFTKNIIARTATLLDASGNTSFPGTISEGGTSLENKYLIVQSGAGFHNSIYRGKYLGSEFTYDQRSAITNGSFDDLYLGDYWTLPTLYNGHTYTCDFMIAGFDYWGLSWGATNASLGHHCAIIMRGIWPVKYTMNSSATTKGGYYGSVMAQSHMSGVESAIKLAFSLDGTQTNTFVLMHPETVSSAVNSSGRVTSVDISKHIAVLPTEVMIYGTNIASYDYAYTNESIEIGYGPYAKTQLPVFRSNPLAITYSGYETPLNYWLQDPVGSYNFASVSSEYGAGALVANSTNGIRPVFAIRGTVN